MKNIEDVYRLSPRQRDLLANDRAVALLQFDLRGALNAAALDGAMRELLRRHSALRTAFIPKGLKEPVQVVRDNVAIVTEHVDWTDLSGSEQRARLDARVATERERPFNLAIAPLMRFVVVRLAPARHRFLLFLHPLLLDERSARLVAIELVTTHQLLARGEERREEAGVPYRDYVAWIEQQDTSRASSAFQALGQGQGALVSTTSSAGHAPGAQRRQQFSLSPDATATVQAVLRKQRLSLGALVDAAWALLLAQATGERELIFGAGTSGRPAAFAKSESAVGCYGGVLPRRVEVPTAGGALLPWLARIKTDRDALDGHAHVSLQQAGALAGRSATERFLGCAVFADTMPDDDARSDLQRRIGIGNLRYDAAPTLPLVVHAEFGQRLILRIAYDREQFESPLVSRMAAHLATIVEAMAANPGATVGTLPTQPPSALAVTAPTQRGLAAGFGARDIESVLAQHSSVRAVAVYPRDGAEGTTLVAEVVAERKAGAPAGKPLDFSMFYFADANASASEDKYRIYLEGATFADRNDFTAVWTPERHFHENGGLYPNPAVLSAALATMTSRVKLRAGSVVVPIQHPLRIAEEWSIVDNLSKGRVGVSIASGWVPNDFAFAPDNYATRRDAMFRGIEQVCTLWAGGTIPAKDGVGNDVALRVFPRPIQRELPLWLTAAGSRETFEKAGELGFNILTSLLAQSIDEAAEKIALYRAARSRAGHDPSTGIVTMMVHTFVGDDLDLVLEQVRAPFTAYLRSHVDLMKTLVESLDLKVDITEPKWLDYLASFAFERYSRQGALLGTPTSCLPLIERLSSIGVDEVACLVDFGVAADTVIAAFPYINELRQLAADDGLRRDRVLSAYLAERLPEMRPDVTYRWVEALSLPSIAGAA
jgi:natural product biosynthesis luciferase-like monooxygenase protein